MNKFFLLWWLVVTTPTGGDISVHSVQVGPFVSREFCTQAGKELNKKWPNNGFERHMHWICLERGISAYDHPGD